MKVKIVLMDMHSDVGYVESSGSQIAFIVSAKIIARCQEDEVSIEEASRKHGTRIRVDELSDVHKKVTRSGVCNYQYIHGVIEVSEDKVLVEIGSESICTNDAPTSWVNIINESNLKVFYQTLSDEYSKLAQGGER